jgi:hypothetical protein
MTKQATQYVSYNEFIASASINYEMIKKAGSPLRYGQVYFVMLDDLYSEIAEQIRSTPLDPFYHDEASAETHAFVESQWPVKPETQETINTKNDDGV